jgi:hypothetical protein
MLLSFPLLVKLTAADIDFSQAKKKGEDIRIAKSDNSPLPYEIEYWDSGFAQASIWIKADTLYGNSAAQYFIMRWGNISLFTLSGKKVMDAGPVLFEPGATQRQVDFNWLAAGKYVCKATCGNSGSYQRIINSVPCR